jgi:hypothetical protein
MDKPEYDRPDDEETSGNKALIFLVLGIVVVGLFYLIFETGAGFK